MQSHVLIIPVIQEMAGELGGISALGTHQDHVRAPNARSNLLALLGWLHLLSAARFWFQV